MINRNLKDKLKQLATKFPVVTINGPRQSGKSTLGKATFPEKEYVTLEDIDNRLFAQNDPRGFLRSYSNAVIDEAQKVPDLFSYIQTAVDEDDVPGKYILTGSNNFLLFEKITQSLAGRTAILKLLPLSIDETEENKTRQVNELIFRGMYPRILKENIDPLDFYPAYIHTYIERDVRLIKNVHDLGLFQLFLKMCAGRNGQLLNLSSLANECGITHTTAKSWLSILEQSYIIFLLRPHHRNFNKRLVKTPKLYFYDTGLASFLLGIQSAEQLVTHYARGSLFESFVISEIIKNRFNAGREHNCYFWRDKIGNEIDCLIDKGINLCAVEIKSGMTVNSDWFKNLKYFSSISKDVALIKSIIYGGNDTQDRTDAKVVSWKDIHENVRLWTMK